MKKKSAEFICIDSLYECSLPSVQEKDGPFAVR